MWQPDAGRNFRPYFYGYWQYTSDYGWLWVSNEPYGDIVYHYGRWVYDPNFGWLWVPGYVWGPSWVAWRETDGYIGWLPMPPGYQDFSLNAVTPSYGPNDLYGYQYFYGSNFAPDAFTGLWVFVPQADFGRSDRRPYVIDKDRVRDLYRRSEDRTHYLHDRDRDRIVDRSIDKDELERSTHRNYGTAESKQFLRPDTPVVPVTEGQDIARRGRERDRGRVGVDANPPIQTTQPERPASARASPFFGRLETPQAPGQPGVVPGAGVATPGTGLPPPLPRRGLFGRFPAGPDPSAAVGAVGRPVMPNIPTTDRLRGAQNPAPGIVAPGAPQVGSGPAPVSPQREFGRVRSRGFGSGVVPSGPVSGAVTLAPAPVLPPVPVSPPPVPSVPIAQPVAPPPPVGAPQAATPAPQRQGGQADPGPQGLFGRRGY